MSSKVGEHVQRLTQYGKVLTISVVEGDRWMISLSDIESEDGILYFMPENFVISQRESLGDALEAFTVHQEMLNAQTMNA